MEGYWKLKAILLETQLALMNLQAQATKHEAQKAAAMTAAGLDPTKPYTFDDDAETVTVVDPKAVA